MVYLKQEIEDVDISALTDDEFRHVGGPIILNASAE